MALTRLTRAEHNGLRGKKEIPKVNENWIILSFVNFTVSPESVTKALKLKPHAVWTKGEAYLRGDIKRRLLKIRKESCWSYEWAFISNADVKDMIEKFIDKIIIPRKKAIKKLSSNCILNFEVVQYFYDGCNPEIWISAKYVKILADINCRIWIDIYCLSKE